MNAYRKILLVVDLTEDSNLVGQRAKSIADSHNASIQLLHVVEYVPVEPMGDALMPAVQIEEELMVNARTRLQELSDRLGLNSSERFVVAGNIKSEIVRKAQEQKVDLIVLGSRERHGLAILLNFTEDTVLHAAPCDVLAVRLK